MGSTNHRHPRSSREQWTNSSSGDLSFPPSPSDPQRRSSSILDFIASIARGLSRTAPNGTKKHIRTQLEHVRSFFRAERCSIWIFDEALHEGDAGSYHEDVWLQSDPSPQLEGEGPKHDPGDHLPPEIATACLDVLQGGTRVWIAGDALDAVPYELAPIEWEALGCQGRLYLPLLHDDNLVGTLRLDAVDPSTLDEDVLHGLDILASLVLQAVLHHHQSTSLCELSDRHRRLFEEGSDIIFELDEEGIVRYVSPAVVQATGYYPAEVIGRDLDTLLHPEDRGSNLKIFEAEGASWQDYRLRDRDGNTRYFRVSMRAVMRQDGECRVSGIARDVTGLREAEFALKAEKAFTDQALDHLPGLFYLVNHNLRIQRWNAQLEEVLGVDPEQIPSCRLTELFDFRMRPEVNDHLKKAFLGDTLQFKADVKINEALVPHMFTAAPVQIEDKRFVVGMGIDISELATAQLRLSESFEALRQIHAISIEDEMPLRQKLRRLLKSGCEYLNATGGVLSQIDDTQYTVWQSVGHGVPDEQSTLSLSDTLCRSVLECPPYEWPVQLSSDTSHAFADATYPATAWGTYVGIPIHVDGEVYGTLSFVGADNIRAGDAEIEDYLKLMTQWIESKLSQVNARRARQRSEARFREIFAAAPDAYFVIDPQTERIADCNHAAGVLTGRPREQLIGQAYRRLHPPEHMWNDAETDLQWLAEVVDSGRWRAENVPIARRAPHHAPVFVDVSARHVDIGARPHVLAVFRDVTQRKEAEDALVEAVSRNELFNEQLQTLIRVSTDLKTHHDVPGTVQRVVSGAVNTLPSATGASLWRFEGDQAILVASDRPTVGCRVHCGHMDVAPDLEGPSLTVPFANGPLATIADGNSASIASIPIAKPDVSELQHTIFHGVRSLVGVSVSFSDGQQGALLAENHRQQSVFGDHERALLDSLGAQASVALNNVHSLQKLHTMSQRLLQAQEEERQRLAQELHDETGGLLTSLQFKLQEIEMHLGHTDDPPSALEPALNALTTSKDLAEELSDLLRRVSRDLRPKILDDLGLPAALSWLTNEFTDRTGIDVDLSNEIESGTRYTKQVETAAFRIIQEALTNVARYADTEYAEVVVNVLDDALRVHVVDHGTGFDVDKWRNTIGDTLGLSGMTERAEQLEGSLDIDAAPGEGTRISATLPITVS